MTNLPGAPTYADSLSMDPDYDEVYMQPVHASFPDCCDKHNKIAAEDEEARPRITQALREMRINGISQQDADNRFRTNNNQSSIYNMGETE